MNNYTYIIAGLPQLALEFDTKKIDFTGYRDSVYSLLCISDKRLVEWMEFGLKESNMNSHFYRVVSRSNNIFLKKYFEVDLLIRNLQTAFSARKQKIDSENFLIGDSQITELLKTNKSSDFGLSNEIEESEKLFQIFENSDILEREQKLDDYRWNTINEITKFNYFDIDYILSYLLKLKIVERWSKLNKEEGGKLLRRFIEELNNSAPNNTNQIEQNS